jgi:hypothetical protein
MYRDLTRLSNWSILATKILFYIQVFMQVYYPYQIWIYSRLASPLISDADFDRLAEQIDLSNAFILLGDGVLSILVLLLNGRWLYLASKNSQIQVPDTGRISPGWTIGWFFVPLANLVRPYTALKELYCVTTNKEERTPEVRWLFIWWILWLVQNGLYRVSGMSLGDTYDTDDLIFETKILWVASICFAICCVYFIRYVREIQENQQAPIAGRSLR